MSLPLPRRRPAMMHTQVARSSPLPGVCRTGHRSAHSAFLLQFPWCRTLVCVSSLSHRSPGTGCVGGGRVVLVFFWQSVGSTIGFPVHILVQSSTQFYYSMMTLFNFCVIKCDLGKKNQFTFVTFDQWLMYQKKVFSKF